MRALDVALGIMLVIVVLVLIGAIPANKTEDSLYKDGNIQKIQVLNNRSMDVGDLSLRLNWQEGSVEFVDFKINKHFAKILLEESRCE